VPWNIIAIDFGTETYSATHYPLVPGKPFDQSNITRIVMASDRNHDWVGPTIAAWHEERWLLGKELQERMQDVSPHKIIRHFKIALYDPHKESSQVQRVQEQLDEAGQTLDQLLLAFFKYVWDDVWMYINEEHLRRTHKPALSETLVYITVPMLVTPDAIGRLKRAAVEAGVPNVLFLHEPLCAGATVLEEVIRKGNLDIPVSVGSLLVPMLQQANSTAFVVEQLHRPRTRLWRRDNGEIP
jgi:molecular chaperone DnaK (HSP70)